MRTLLKQYLQENQIQQAEAAKQLGVSRTYFNAIVNGDNAGRALAERIEQWTNGAIKREDLIWPARAQS